jgi:hypothetical protein
LCADKSTQAATVAAHGTPGSVFGCGLGVVVFDVAGIGLALLEVGVGVSLVLGAVVLGVGTAEATAGPTLPPASGAPPVAPPEHAASTTVATSADTPARILFTATYPRYPRLSTP